MSLYAEYIKERQNKHIVEHDNGFATFTIDSGICYLEDLYVKPAFRRMHTATLLADKVVEKAKECGCKRLIGSVVPSTQGSTSSLKVLLSYGFSLSKSDNNIIWFVKEI